MMWRPLGRLGIAAVFSTLLPIASHASVDITLALERVEDNVDYSPNLETGGFANPQSRPRFQASSLGVRWQVSPRTSLGASFTQREVNSLRDSFDISQLSVSATRLLAPATARYTLGTSVNLSMNFSDVLFKNSYTNYNGAVIRGASINRPQDQTLTAGFFAGLNLKHGFSLSARVAAGVLKSDHDYIEGQGQSSDGCEYAFTASEQNGSLNQQGSCGALVRYSQEFTSEQGVEERLGFLPSQDVSYRAQFIEAGTGMTWTRQALSLLLDYRFRQYQRGQLDVRIEDNGDTPTRASQIARANLSYRFSKRWSLSMSSIYQTAPYLDDVPMLYTAFTSQRFSDATALSFLISSTFTF